MTSVSGKLTNCKFKKASLYTNGQETILAAQADIDSTGKFSMQFENPVLNIYRLQFEDGMYVSLILEPGDKAHVTGDLNDFLNTLKFEGSDQSSQIYESDQALKGYKKKLDSINTAYYQGMQTGITDSVVQVLTADYRATEQEQNDYLVRFITSHPGSMAGLFVVDRLSIDQYFDTYEVMDQHLYKKYPENVFVQNFHKRVTNAKKLAINAPAPEIALPDPEGNVVKLSSLKGKVVVIDFWASWCGPCRKESPNMVRLFNTYKDKGFTIFSVSLDKAKDAWIKAIKDDGLTWTHVSDLKFWQCEAALNYNVTAVPYMVLLDKDGNIAAKNLRGADLEKKIAELLGKN